MSTPDPLRPAVEDVAALLRARTKDAEGREVGTFNDETRPTDVEVEIHIDAAIGLVSVRFPPTLDVRWQPAFRSLVAYRAALRVEKSYFPEQIRTDRSPYDELRQEYLDDLEALSAAVAGSGEDAGYGNTGAGSEWTPTFLKVYGDVTLDRWPEPENPENWRQPLQPPREPPLPEDLPVGDRPASGVEWH
jgi:hypothetical protein